MKDAIDFLALGLLYAFCFFKKWKAKGADVLFINSLLFLYLSFVLYFTMMPILVKIPFILNHPYKSMNLIPFIDVSLARGDFLRQIILNGIMTIPFGFLYPLTQKNRTSGFLKTLFICFLMSLTIELLQPLISSRSSDITDIITNCIGCMIGYGLYALLKPIPVWILDHLKSDTSF